MDKPKKNLKPQNQFNPYLKFSGLAIQMAVVIYLGNLLGVYVDEKYGNQSDIYMKLFTLLAVFLSIFTIIRQVIKSDKKE